MLFGTFTKYSDISKFQQNIMLVNLVRIKLYRKVILNPESGKKANDKIYDCKVSKENFHIENFKIGSSSFECIITSPVFFFFFLSKLSENLVTKKYK